MDIFRQEIIETQKARSELVKWKIVLVSALAATGLGFSKSESDINAEAVLCCIPFVCAYVDSQYANLSLRIIGIATFFREVGPSVGVNQSLFEYERLMAFAVSHLRKHHSKLGHHSFQSWIVRTSSVLFSGLIALYAAASLIIRTSNLNIWIMVVMFCTGVGGVVFDIWLFHHNRRRRRIIEEAGAEYASKIKSEDTERYCS